MADSPLIGLGLAPNAAVFIGSAAVVWAAGSRLSRYADVLAARTKMSEAFTGLVLLAGATSLPELATTITASAIGNAHLALNNLLGGIVMQTAVLAAADLIAVRGALTFFTPKAVLLVQGVLLVMLLGLTLALVAAGEPITLFAVGLGSLSIGLAYTAALWIAQRYEEQAGWEPVNPPEQDSQARRLRDRNSQRFKSRSTQAVWALFALASAAVVIAGWAVATSADALAQSTGLGGSFVGATFLALATSLPEVSTTIAAARLGAYSMAVSNIFGSNALMVALIPVADVFYRAGPILDQADASVSFTAGLGVVVTCVYLLGLLERKDKQILRMGIDSIIVSILFILSIAALYLLR